MFMSGKGLILFWFVFLRSFLQCLFHLFRLFAHSTAQTLMLIHLFCWHNCKFLLNRIQRTSIRLRHIHKAFLLRLSHRLTCISQLPFPRLALHSLRFRLPYRRQCFHLPVRPLHPHPSSLLIRLIITLHALLPAMRKINALFAVIMIAMLYCQCYRIAVEFDA